MKSRSAIILLAIALAALQACGGSDSTGGKDTVSLTDLSGDQASGSEDISGSDAMGDLLADALPDTAQDTGPLLENQALVFVNNPSKDEGNRTQVELVNIEDEDGLMSGPYANVFNCLNEDGGWTRDYELPLFGAVHVQLCNIKKTVAPDETGNYLDVEVPEDLMDPNDPFAELMMFYHMNVIHDYYSQVHGYTGMDFPLEAYVNIMAYLEMANPFPGVPTGWVTFDNAMYMPKESFEMIEEQGEILLKEYLGIEDKLDLPFKNDAIFFMQGTSLDFAYDSDVTYHEYTHALVGSDRLQGYGIDEHGPDAAPGGINEAYADYFSCTVHGDPKMAEFALETLGAGRDLSQVKTCPADYFGEVHEDSMIYSSALWRIREELGQEVADQLIFNALLSFGYDTCFEEAAEITIEEASQMDPPVDTQVRAIFEDQGILGCNGRVKDYADYEAGSFPEYVGGTQVIGVSAFNSGVPGYVQHRFEVPEGTTSIHLQIHAESAGLMSILGSFMGMPAEVEVGMALKREDPITYSYTPFTHDEDGVVEFNDLGDGDFDVLISGSCLTPGVHHLQFINRSADEIYLYTTKMTFSSDELPEDNQANYDCQE